MGGFFAKTAMVQNYREARVRSSGIFACMELNYYYPKKWFCANVKIRNSALYIKMTALNVHQ